MCGFVGVFEIGRNGENLRAQVLRMSGKIRHRGPDWSGIYCGPRAVLSHERLSIVDPQSGGQPLYSPDGRLVLAVNGEIYNHRKPDGLTAIKPLNRPLPKLRSRLICHYGLFK